MIQFEPLAFRMGKLRVGMTRSLTTDRTGTGRSSKTRIRRTVFLFPSFSSRFHSRAVKRLYAMVPHMHSTSDGSLSAGAANLL